MIYLIFDTEQDAIANNGIISENMNLTSSITTVWAEPRERLDGKWVFPRPEDRFMTGVVATEEEFDADWFAAPSIPE